MRNVCRKNSAAAAGGGSGSSSRVEKQKKKGKKTSKSTKKDTEKKPPKKRGRPKKENPAPKPFKPNLQFERSLLGQVGELQDVAGEPEELQQKMLIAKETAALTKIEQSVIWSEKHVGQFRMPVNVLE